MSKWKLPLKVFIEEEKKGISNYRILRTRMNKDRIAKNYIDYIDSIIEDENLHLQTLKSILDSIEA